MKPIETVLSKLEGVHPIGDTGRQWAACCPAHADTEASLGVAVTGAGAVLLRCYASCEAPAIVEALGLTIRDLFIVPEPADNGITIGRLAHLKRLPANWLIHCKLRPVAGCNEIEIPYLDADSKELFARRRVGPKGKDTLQPNGTPLTAPYGLWKLAAWAEAGERTLLLVEGESDCWSLWLHGFPALGVPGAKALAAIKAEHVSGFETVIVWAEPGKAGEGFGQKLPAKLKAEGFAGTVLVYHAAADAKDPSDIAAKQGNKFPTYFRELLKHAVEPGPAPVEQARGSEFKDSPYPWGKFEFTEVGNAERFIHLHGRDLLYVGPLKSWAAWNGTRWRVDDSEQIQERALVAIRGIAREAQEAPSDTAKLWAEQWYQSSQKANAVSAMVKLARGKVTKMPQDFNSRPTLFNCANGTVDLATGRLLDPERTHLFTTFTAIDYDADAECPAWETALAAMFPRNGEEPGGDEELLEFIQRLCGYCLTGLTSDAILPILWGSGSNGKSTFIRVLLNVMGPDFAMQAPHGFLMEKRGGDQHPTQLAMLYGKRAVFASETEEGRKLDVPLMKAMTGSDVITARWIGKDYFQFTPTHKLLLATNHKPKINSTDHGTWRRLAMIPFNAKFWNPDEGETGPDHLKQDRQLVEKLHNELPGILAWMVRGATAYLRDGLRRPSVVLAATKDYRDDEDMLSQFLAECTVTSHTDYVSKSDFYSAFEEWMKAQGIKHPWGERTLGKKMVTMGFSKDDRAGNGGPRVWKGLRLLGKGSVADIDEL